MVMFFGKSRQFCLLDVEYFICPITLTIMSSEKRKLLRKINGLKRKAETEGTANQYVSDM